jgi:hypothetical protein
MGSLKLVRWQVQQPALNEETRIGGEILRVVYGRLNMAVEFEDVPGTRAQELSSAGELDSRGQEAEAAIAHHFTLAAAREDLHLSLPA